MKKRLKKAQLKIKRNDKFNIGLLAFFAVSAVLAGYFLIFTKAAPPPPTIYLSPATQTVGPNGTITVQVRENSSTTAVNAAQANFSYPTSLLSYVSTDTTGSAFTTQAETLPYTLGTIAQSGTAITGTGTGWGPYITGQTITYSDSTTATVTYVDGQHLTSSVSKTVTAGSTYVIGKTSGNVALGVGNTAAQTGDQLIATLTFRAGATSGSAALAFTSGTVLISSSTNNDILGGLGATGGATYTVDTTGPVTSVTAPANNATLAYGSNTTVSVSSVDAASAVSKVEIYIDGSLINTINGTGPYNYTWSGATLGAHTIYAKGYDTFNNVTTSSTINVNVTDQTAPTVSVTAPIANAVVNGSSTAVTATAADNVGVAGVQFKLDGVNLGAEDTTSPYSINWDTTTATSATHSITAVARDAAGNTTPSTAVSVLVDNAAPTVSITSPTGGNIGSNDTTTVTATAADNGGGSGLAKVEFYVDGVLKATDNAGPYTYALADSTLTLGAHSLTAKAYDKAPTPNVTTSATVNVTVIDNTPPNPPTALHTTATGLTTINLAWTAGSDNVGVTGYQVKRNGTLLTTTGAGVLTYNDTGLSPGTNYTYNVLAVDAAGNVSSAAVLSASTITGKPGDINLDGNVDIQDLSMLLSSFGSATNACITVPQYTCNLIAPNGVDIQDLSVLLSNFGA